MKYLVNRAQVASTNVRGMGEHSCRTSMQGGSDLYLDIDALASVWRRGRLQPSSASTAIVSDGVIGPQHDPCLRLQLEQCHVRGAGWLWYNDVFVANYSLALLVAGCRDGSGGGLSKVRRGQRAAAGVGNLDRTPVMSTTSTTAEPSKRHASTPLDKQRAQLEKLLKDPSKPAYIPPPPKEKTVRPAREMMKNVQGSSAGAGSGEFHVYKASRRREYERLKLMEDQSKQVRPP